MEFEDNIQLNELVENYKRLTSENKKEILEKEILELLVFLQKENERIGIKDNRILFNREILDLKKDTVSNDDFAEAIYVYLQAIKELLAKYFSKNKSNRR